MIVEIKECPRQFHRAHSAVIEYLGGAAKIARQKHFTKLKEGWQELHDVRVSGEVGSWQYLEFDIEVEYMLWLLRWS